MVEKYLLDLGLGCGSVKNFNTEILKNMRFSNGQKWYFKTPIKITDNNGLKTATINLAFPFLAIQTDITEADVIKRISLVKTCYENQLIKVLRKKFIVPDYYLAIIPFWANDGNGNERIDRKDFAQTRVHILNAVVNVKYRDSNFSCKC